MTTKVTTPDAGLGIGHLPGESALESRPRWQFSSPADVSEGEVDRHFASLGERELSFG